MTPILFDYADQKDHNMMPPVKEIGFEIDYGPLKVVVAVVLIVAVSLILMKF